MILGAMAAVGSAIKNATIQDGNQAWRKSAENPFLNTVIPKDITQDISITLQRTKIGRRHF